MVSDSLAGWKDPNSFTLQDCWSRELNDCEQTALDQWRVSLPAKGGNKEINKASEKNNIKNTGTVLEELQWLLERKKN